jgi:signal transduction histidine kinase
MPALSEARTLVATATNEAELAHGLIELSSALYEYDAVEAGRVANDALAVAENAGRHDLVAEARHYRGWASSAQGDFVSALRDHLVALEDFERLGDVAGVAMATAAVGDLYGDAGDARTALDYLERAVGMLDQIVDPKVHGAVLNLAGIAVSREGRHREALATFERAENVFAQAGDFVRVSTAMINQAFELIELASESPAVLAKAEALAAAVIERGRSTGEDGHSTETYGHALAARVLAERGDRRGALDEAAAAWRAALTAGFAPLASDIALDRVGWLIDEGSLEAAEAELHAVAACNPDPRASARVAELEASLFEALGDPTSALRAYREFVRLTRGLHDEDSERLGRLTAIRLETAAARAAAETAEHRVAELEALDRDKREFLASVSHELRTPLTAIIGFATELVSGWDALGDDEALEFVETIAWQAGDMAAIVDDLLALTRLQAGTLRVGAGIIDVGSIVSDLAGSLGRQFGRSVSTVGSSTGWADAGRVRQIVRNLITNAIRHGGERIEIEVCEDRERVIVDVRDSGPPIPAERARQMFAPFVHAEDQVRSPHSVGLGLTVARSLAEAMGGSLEYVAQEVSVFRLSLPRVPVDLPTTDVDECPGGAAPPET